MASFAGLLSRAERQRLLDRLDELAGLDREMRRPGTLAAPRHRATGATTRDTTAKKAPDDAED